MTLVVNAAQGAVLPDQEAFLGLKVLAAEERAQESINWEEFDERRGRAVTRSDHYAVMPVELTGAEVVRYAEQSGWPLLTRHGYGQGHVLVTTPYYMLLRDRATPNPLIEELLADLQREVLPVQVRGDVQFLLNKITAEHWKIVVLNNKGVLKHPQSPEMQVRGYAADVLLTAPPGAAAEEILHGESMDVTTHPRETLISFTVPPGGIRIVDVKMSP